VTVGGRARGDDAQFGALLGQVPAKNCVKVTETLLGLYEKTKLPAEDFNSFVARTGTERLKEILEPLRQVPSFEKDPFVLRGLRTRARALRGAQRHQG